MSSVWAIDWIRSRFWIHTKTKPAQIQRCSGDILQSDHLLQIQWSKTALDRPVWSTTCTGTIWSSLCGWGRRSGHVHHNLILDGLLQFDKFDILRTSSWKLLHDTVRHHQTAIPQRKNLQTRLSSGCCRRSLFRRGLWTFIPMGVDRISQSLRSIGLILAEHAKIFCSRPALCKHAFNGSSSKLCMPGWRMKNTTQNVRQTSWPDADSNASDISYLVITTVSFGHKPESLSQTFDLFRLTVWPVWDGIQQENTVLLSQLQTLKVGVNDMGMAGHSLP